MSSAGSRLTSVSNPSYTAAYTYAPDGIRLSIQESNAQYTDRWMQPLGPFGAGVAAQRVQPYDGVRPVLEGTLSGDVYTTTAKYVWEGNSYYSPLMYSLIGGAWRYHMYDGLGSTRQLMLHASPYTVTDTYSYEAFGNLMASTGTTPNLARSRPPVGGRDRHGGAARPHLATYRYVGSLGYYQTGNDLMQLGARYYMPEVGRFTRRGSPYTYSGSNPVTRAQPTGAGASQWVCPGDVRMFCPDDPYVYPTPPEPIKIPPPTIGPWYPWKTPRPGNWRHPKCPDDCLEGHGPFGASHSFLDWFFQFGLAEGATARGDCERCCDSFLTEAEKCKQKCRDSFGHDMDAPDFG